MKTFSYPQIIKIAYPILLSTLMEQVIGMTDTAFLGRVGEIELGAVALGGIFYIALFMFGLGFSLGAQILMARRNGEGHYDRIGGIFYHSVAFLLLLALVLFGLSRYFSPWLLDRIISSPEVSHAATDYLQWREWSFFFAFVSAMFRSFFIATTHTRTLTLNSVVMVTANIIFNYVLIFGRFGCPAMGIAGAGLGSTLAEAVSLLFFIGYTWRRVPCATYALNRLPRFRFGLLRRLLSVSVWTMIQDFLSLSTWFLFFLSVEHLGKQSLAATNVVRNVSAFTFMTVIALASTATTLTSNLIGQGEAQSVHSMLRRTVRLGFIILLPVIALIAVFPDAVLGVFTDNSAIISEARGALFVMLSSYIFTIPAQILFHAVSGTGNTLTALVIELLALTIYTAFVFIAIFGYRIPLAACWLSEHIYGCCALLFSYSYLRWGHWQQKSI